MIDLFHHELPRFRIKQDLAFGSVNGGKIHRMAGMRFLEDKINARPRLVEECRV